MPLSTNGNINPVIHCMAGGIAGTVAASVTCPLEVLKTRLQSTVSTFQPSFTSPTSACYTGRAHGFNTFVKSTAGAGLSEPLVILPTERRIIGLGIWHCLRHIVQTEGYTALFKGLGPNLVGIAPSRAAYFTAYANTKCLLNEYLTPNTAPVHMGAAIAAGASSATLTNPIWYIKTHLQLDQSGMSSSRLTVSQCVQRTYQRYGLRGFYKGLSASYYGTAETVIHFVIYEEVKGRFMCYTNPALTALTDAGIPGVDFFKCMMAAIISKSCAAFLAYPHEVARTRLRQDGDKYRRFIQTIVLIAREEGRAGLYRGLCTQLVRQIPNTAIMMATYEAIVTWYRERQPLAELRDLTHS